MIKIRTISNGWVVEDELGAEEAHTDIQSLFRDLLLKLAGKSDGFGGSMYGKVTVSFKEPSK